MTGSSKNQSIMFITILKDGEAFVKMIKGQAFSCNRLFLDALF